MSPKRLNNSKPFPCPVCKGTGFGAADRPEGAHCDMCEGTGEFKGEIRYGRPVITVAMRKQMPCPFPRSEPR